MSRTLYVTDLDGTLMRDDKTISETTTAIMNGLIARGALITYATARSITSASAITGNIHFQIPVIVRNGTILADPRTNHEIEIAMFTGENLSKIQQCIKGMNVPGFATVYIDGEERKNYVTGRINEGFRHYLEDHADDKRMRVVQTEEELFQGSVCYFTFIADQAELDPLYEKVKGCEEWVCVYQKDKYRPEYWLELAPRTATKASAIQKLQKQYGCQRLVVFGDSLNDISMFQIADEAYAIETGDERLKEMATGIIGDNNCDSVARWIEADAGKFDFHKM